jgi:hypothetical protein
MKFGKTSQKRLKGVVDRLGLIVGVCMCCNRFIRLNRVKGAEGGFSHGLCPKGCDEALAWGFDVGVIK